MTRSHVVVNPPPVPPGQKISTDEKVDGSGNTVQDQIIRVGGAAVDELQDVRNTTPGVSDYGAVVRIAGTVDTELSASDPLVVSFGEAADAAATAGDVGTLQAKVRLLTGQLATMLTSLTTLLGHVDGLEGFVDGLEAALTTLNAKAFLTNTELRATPVPVSGTVTASGPLTDAQLRAAAVPVSGTVGVTGVATESTLNAIGALIVTIQGYVDGIEAALAALNAKDFATQTTLAAVAASASVLDDWDETDRAKVNPIAGQAGVQGGAGTVTALTQRVAIATDAPVPFVAAAATVARTSVGDAATSTQLIIANAARRTLSIFNDSTAYLYVNLDGTAASTSNFSVKVSPGGLYEAVDRIVGAVFGIWSSDAGGSARITETT